MLPVGVSDAGDCAPGEAGAAVEGEGVRSFRVTSTGVGLVAYQSDMRKIAPTAQLTAITHQWGGYYTAVAQQVLAGTWRAVPVWGGMKDGFVQLAALGPSVPPAVAARVDARKSDIVAGRFHPFSGRIVDSEGRVRQAGGTMADAQIATMNYFVEGVVGTLPKS